MKMLAKAGKTAEDAPVMCLVLNEGESGTEISLAEIAMREAMHPDHAAQKAVWEGAQGWKRGPDSNREALTEASIASTDRLARFVGIEGYVENGGAVTRDLFADEETNYLDRTLVLQLAEAKLAQEAEAFRAEGWKWVRWEFERLERLLRPSARQGLGEEPGEGWGPALYRSGRAGEGRARSHRLARISHRAEVHRGSESGKVVLRERLA